MTTVPQVASIWHSAGVSTIPVLANGTKKPAIQWGTYQARIPDLGELDRWWGNGHEYGLALIMGSVSGNLEMLELEGRVFTSDGWSKIARILAERGLDEAWDNLFFNGYTEESPAGGIHLIYHIEDRPVPGNEKIARRVATAEELNDNPHDKVKVLAETRGEGGYVIVAPTPGLCHPTGKQWVKLYGEYGQFASIPWSVRQALHDAIRDALDEVPPVTSSAPPVPAVTGVGTGLRPGEDWSGRISWDTLLTNYGWTHSHQTGNESYWVRPGKSRRDGHSATINYANSDLLKVFSTSVEGLDSEATYTKFGFYAAMEHHGDHRAAAQALALQGYGTPLARIDDHNLVLDAEVVAQAPKPVRFALDETGNNMRLWNRVQGNFHYVPEERTYYTWNGTKWEDDWDGALDREFIQLTEEMLDDADDDVRKWGSRSRSVARRTAARSGMQSLRGVSKRRRDFDADLHLLNVHNGTLNLRTGELQAHDSRNLITRTFDARHDPQATCPSFMKFIKAALPDPEMRGYVQRALASSLLGSADQRSLFIIHGPSGTGKSTLLETMRALFGDYGNTAAPGTFRRRQNDNGPTNDLHGLRGRRFITSSETADSVSFDEETLKRLTGRDRIQSRDLYQSNQEWVPECTIWLATNHLPKFTSDDNAIWRRIKLIPFLTEFCGDTEIPDMARTLLVPEADGILNWLLAGLADFLEFGLAEPEAIAREAAALRQVSDPVSRFLDDRVTEGVLVLSETAVARTTELYGIYRIWCQDSGERSLGMRRFINRVTEAVPVHYDPVGKWWRGIGRASGASILGTMLT